ncbi:beta-ketoacyl-ACP synthase [Synechocystis sp. PCC 7509]|uniref:beta-ketoacyl-ACP synthase n=1 Tax=Synechocystis sp. PCC 7509 TaxID=927677 RepID=UPI0002ACD0E3|nr:beta-ketoacyl-ACP synthase [Synechocystis sp. PCC 7509]
MSFFNQVDNQDVVVTGIGLVSALGNNLAANWQQLIAGNSAIKLHQPFPELPPLPLGLIGDQPICLKTLTSQVVSNAIADSGLNIPLTDCGVVIGSSRSYQASWELLAKKFALNNEFDSDCLEILPHMNAIAVARQIGASLVPVLAPMAACATGIWSIFQAFELIKTGRCQRVLAGAVEAPITPLTLAGFKQMGAMAATGSFPFDHYRQGLVLGEGGAVLVLESAKLAWKRSARIYGQIRGFGLTSDAYYASQPSPQGQSAKLAVKQCLERSHLLPTDIDYIHAHGTATQKGDRHEAQLIADIFPQSVAISSTKGATGHTLGASGAIGAAFCLEALQQQVLPPNVGLQLPEFNLNLVTKSRQNQTKQVLCFSFGFGGQNAVMAISKSE